MGMLETRLTELLGCRYPIVQTAMGWVADPKLVAGSCNAGGFGFLAGATIPAHEMERDILRVRELTDQPFGVNFHMYQPNAADIVELVIRHGVKAVSYSRSPGPDMIRKLKDAGVVCMPTIGLPTSVGYGAGGGGVAALLSMLQTCVPGLAVVNIDNGIGAGATAALIANGRAVGRGA